MKKFWAIALLVLLTANGIAQPAAGQTDFDDFERTVLAELKERRASGAAVAVVSGGRVVFAKGFGSANVETGAPVTPDTLFQTGSLTKTLTAFAALGLAREGAIKLDAPIGNYAKNLTPKLAQVTLHQLLSHTAGVIDEPDEYGGQDEPMMASYLRSWKDDYRPFAPGEIFSYSNSGFALAGFALQEATAKPYADLMTERVFRPLGMTRTTFRPTVAMTYPLAVGHRREGDALAVVRPLPHDARLYPAGTAYTSANELARFAVAFLNEGRIDGKQIFAPEIIKEMSAPRVRHLSSPNETTHYGYGLFMNDFRGVHRVWHDGSMTGYTASLMFVPAYRLAVVILVNTDGAVLGRTQDKALEMFVPLAPKPAAQAKTPLAVSATEMRNLVGVYSQPNRWQCEVFIKDGKLFLKQFDREMPLTKIAENRFSFQFPTPEITQELTFKIGTDGKATLLQQFVWAFKRVEAMK